MSSPLASSSQSVASSIKPIRFSPFASSSEPLSPSSSDTYNSLPIRTAIELKTAIEAAPNLASIGYCATQEEKFNKAHGNQDESDEDDEDEEEDETDMSSTKLIKLIDSVENIENVFQQHTPGLYLEKFYDDSITVFPGTKDELSIKIWDIQESKHLRAWFAHSESQPSPFGDVASLKTVLDSSVRDARELGPHQFSVSQEMIKKVEKKWAKCFFPTKVKAIPQKINLYQENGLFRAHRDTPSNKLVGTFLVGLGDTASCKSESNKETGKKQKKDDEIPTFTVTHNGKEFKWRALLGSWCAFYSNVLHEVKPINHGFRATISFDIEVDGESDIDYGNELTRHELLLKQTLAKLGNVNGTFGIMLSHMYAIKAMSLKGSDKFIHSALLTLKNRHVFLLPVVTEFSGQYGEGFKLYTESSVYPLTDAHVDYLLNKTDEEPTHLSPDVKWDDVSNIPFFAYNFNFDGFQWSSFRQPYCESMGNNSAPGREDSLYIHMAMIVMPKQVTSSSSSSSSSSS
jgi:hypothetical protein